jgi:dipeptidyl aminopeptidase/acylaminoacyl peptidase
MDLRSGQRAAPLETNVRDVRYTSGYLVYVNRNNSLFAVALDVGRRRTSGTPVRIADSVAGGDQGIAQLAVARNGTVAYIPLDELTLVFADRSGNERPAHADLHNYHAPRFAPDGRRVAVDFTGTDGTRDVWILDPEQNTLQRATSSQGADVGGHDPTWTPDGRYISYLVQRDSVWRVFRTRASGGAPPESLFARKGGLAFTGLWLPDASALIPVTGAAGEDIAIVRNGGHGAIEPLVADKGTIEYAPAPSPDGRWLAYVSDKSGPGRWEVYLRGLGSDPEEIKVSQDGGTEPVWSATRSRNGWELFYRRGGDRDELLSAHIEERPTLRVTERRALFSVSDIVAGGDHANYDVSPDGQTFVMVRANPKARIVIIQNLPALVARLRGSPPNSR